MRTLLLLRGAPGCGKSTYIEKNGLKPYTLSSDDLRLLFGSPRLMPDGRNVISNKIDGVVWAKLFEILEFRMQNGEFTVIDACNSKTSEMSRYRQLAQKYRYRIYIIDFTKIPLEQCLKQNKLRPEYKWVPDEAIENIYARFDNQKVPSGITVIQPDELENIYEKPIDLSCYKKIIHIGDIHGCFNTLNKYFTENPISSENCYIFTGDYMDRGDQNLETIQFLDSIKDLPNVCLLEGNHEIHIAKYGEGEPSRSKEFNFRTMPKLVEGGFTEKQARMFYRKVRQFSHYIFNDKEVLACHGGIPSMNSNLLFLQTDTFIHGSGRYEDYETIAETWMSETKENQYLIHGHRNTSGSEIQIADRVFNLEGSIEFGGSLRIVELSESGFKTIEIENCQEVKLKKKKEVTEIKDTKEAIEILRCNPMIIEKDLGDNISSFNFSRQAFIKRQWDKQTILARGLFMNTEKNEIVARSYEKFFNLGENTDTLPSTLKMKLSFPLKVYLKENGFLGMVSWNTEKDELFIASKSTNTGEYVKYFKDILFSKYDISKLSEYLKNNSNVTMVFEVIDPINDPHIIKYDDSKLVLLDIIYNTLSFDKVSYKELGLVGNSLGFEVKKLVMILNDFESFKELYTNAELLDYSLEGHPIEGFVIEDSNKYMVKIKTGYYKEWKKLRPIAYSTVKHGRYMKLACLTTAMENNFYKFCKECFERGEEFTNIIDLRERFIRGYK